MNMLRILAGLLPVAWSAFLILAMESSKNFWFNMFIITTIILIGLGVAHCAQFAVGV